MSSQSALVLLPRRGVLLALRGAERPESALAEASMLAGTLNDELRVVRVVKEPSALRQLLTWVSHVQFLRNEHFATRRWLVERLGELGSTIRLTLTYGDFLERTALEARAARSALIVVPPRSARASRVADLARRSGTDVLVARVASRSGTVLAATDLERADAPVVARAAALARDLHSELVALHNANPLWVSSSAGLPDLPVVSPRTSVTQQRKQRLAAVVDSLPIPATPIITSSIEPVRAILQEASARNAGLIVVGTHVRPSWDRPLRGSVAAQVVRCARQSVLVTPIG